MPGLTAKGRIVARWTIVLCAALLTPSFASGNAAPVAGSWTARAETERSGQLYLSVEIDSGDNHGSMFDPSAFTGLSPADIASKTRLPVRFTLAREPGTLTFAGTFQEGRGGGDFTFAPNRDYVNRLQALGVRFEAKGGDDDRELMHLALFDVSTAFIRSMKALGYDEPLDR